MTDPHGAWVPGAHPALFNDDLAPTRPEQRTWNVWSFAALWVGMAVCIPTYMLASSLMGKGMAWWQAIVTILLGNAIVLVPMVLNAHAGARYGVPYPVFARAAFGVFGANVPAMLRAIVACGWFGIQTWIGGAAIYQAVEALSPGLLELPRVFPAALGLETGPFLCFLIFWVINMAVVWRGLESIKWIEVWAAPFLLVCGLALLGWAVARVGGFGPILDRPASFPVGEDFWSVFFPGLTAMVGFWATLSLNIPDFTRYARSQRDQVLGQAIGLPTTMTLFSFIGVAVTGATVILFGKEIWDPVALVGRFGSPVVVCVAMVALAIATLSTNIAANVVGPANDFSNLAPKRITFKLGATITGILGIVIMPWKLLANPDGYIFTWLIGYSALLGPIGGILIADYFIVRRTELLATDLYRHPGSYSYGGGVNWVAMFALVASILPNVPGFLAKVGAVPEATVTPAFHTIYTYAWFVGFFSAGAIYVILTWAATRSAAGAAAPTA
ncbi:MAG: nitrate reductase [Myxococcales bacterium]